MKNFRNAAMPCSLYRKANGHSFEFPKRSGMNKGLPLNEADAKSDDNEQEIEKLSESAEPTDLLIRFLLHEPP